MNLAAIVEAYSQQYQWRSWPKVFEALPSLEGQTVLDLGCGIGDLSSDLTAKGARVIGVDINEEVVAYANGRRITNAEFRIADLRQFRAPDVTADGIWSSFTAAYFPALQGTIASWIEDLRPGGWLALTEVDDLFGHRPLSRRTAELLEGYVIESLDQSRYDFQMGRKMGGVLHQIGMVVDHEFTLPDAELSFFGPALPAVLEAWQTRFERMQLLQKYCGSAFQQVRQEFLDCLTRDDHRSQATVRCCIARKPEGGSRADFGSL